MKNAKLTKKYVTIKEIFMIIYERYGILCQKKIGICLI